MHQRIKNIGSWVRSLQGWIFLIVTGIPTLGAYVSGHMEALPWAVRISHTMLALASGASLVLCGIIIWEKIGGKKQKALLALGQIWEDGASFRNEASKRHLTDDDLKKISDFESEILKNVEIVNKLALSKFKKINVFDPNEHPAEVQEDVRGDKKLLVFSERIKRVGDFIEKHSG